jgi:hypothetical protein
LMSTPIGADDSSTVGWTDSSTQFSRSFYLQNDKDPASLRRN